MASLGLWNRPPDKGIDLDDGLHPGVLRTERRKNTDGTYYWVVKLYNGTGGALTAGQVYRVTYSGASVTAQNPRVAAPAAIATLLQQTVIAVSATPDATWDWFVALGHYDGPVHGTVDVAVGDFLKTSGTNTYLIKDAATQSANSVAIACAAFDTDATVAAKRMYFFGWNGAVLT